MGARPMQRLIQDMIRRALADELLFGRLVDGGRLTVDIALKTDEKGVETGEVVLTSHHCPNRQRKTAKPNLKLRKFRKAKSPSHGRRYSKGWQLRFPALFYITLINIWLHTHFFGTTTKPSASTRALTVPAQFAAIRTDADLNVIGEPIMLYCQPAPDYLPDPASCLITGITPQVCLERGIPEHEFAAQIEAALARTRHHWRGLQHHSV